MKNNKYLFLITITYFIFGFINIHFAILGFICMILPFVLLIKNQKKTWCQGYCPRASLYVQVGKKRKHTRKTPNFFVKGNMKWILLTYFGISLTIILLSTIKVAQGQIPAMEYLRFLLVVPIPWSLPQLFHIQHDLTWLTHLSYRFYSMMMTTTILGLLMAVIYKPRTWCTVCPVGTLSELYIKGKKAPRSKA